MGSSRSWRELGRKSERSRWVSPWGAAPAGPAKHRIYHMLYVTPGQAPAAPSGGWGAGGGSGCGGGGGRRHAVEEVGERANVERLLHQRLPKPGEELRHLARVGVARNEHQLVQRGGLDRRDPVVDLDARHPGHPEVGDDRLKPAEPGERAVVEAEDL